MRQIIYKVVISTTSIAYYINTKSLEDIFDLIVTKKEVNNDEPNEISDREYEVMVVPCELKRVNQGKTLIIGNQQTSKNGSLFEILKKSWEWHESILKGVIYEIFH